MTRRTLVLLMALAFFAAGASAAYAATNGFFEGGQDTWVTT
jgi:hypothetical protein